MKYSLKTFTVLFAVVLSITVFGENLLPDTGISKASGWNLWANKPVLNAGGFAIMRDGMAVVKSPGIKKQIATNVQLIKSLDLETDKSYNLRFKANAEKAGNLTASYILSKPPYTVYGSTTIKLDAGEKEYECTLAIQNDKNGNDAAPRSLRLFFGAFKNTTVSIADISLSTVAAVGSVKPRLSTNQPVKKMLVVGDSITKHAPAKSLGWSGNWGMAASSMEKDFAHLLYAKLCAAQSEKPELIINALGGGTIAGKLANLSSITKHAADLVIIQLGENDRKVTPKDFEQPYEKLIEAVKKANPDAHIYCCGAWRCGPLKNTMIRNACLRQGAVFVDISAVYADPTASAGSEKRFTHAGVNWHPGDKGMQGYAEALWKAIREPHRTPENPVAYVKKASRSVGTDNYIFSTGINIVPQPKSVVWNKDSFLLTKDMVLVSGKENRIAAQDLQQELENVCGIKCPVVAAQEDIGKRKIILQIGGLDDKDSKNKEGYTLCVDGDGIVIRSKGAPGVFYGVQTLKQLLQRQGKDLVVPGCEIRDEPTLGMRGVHMTLTKCVASTRAVQELKRMIDTFAQLKLNTMMIEIGGNMRYSRQSFPLSEKRAFTKDQVKELVNYAKARYFEVIPTYQMLSHCKWILDNPKNVAFLENPADRSWGATWCPSNLAVYDFMKDIIDEASEVFQPRYFNVSLDEIGAFGVCEKCSKVKDPSQLFLKTILYLHDNLAAHGIKTIMWHDMLLPAGEVVGGNLAQGYKIVDQIPKDVIIGYWDYSVFDAAAKKRLEYFTQKGFSVLGASFLKPQGIQTLNAGLAANAKVIGHVNTHWYDVGNWSKVGTISPSAWLAITLGAQYAWSPAIPALEDIHYDPIYKIRQMYVPKRSLTENGVWELIPLEQAFNGCISDDVQSWPGYGVQNSLSSVFDENIVCDDVPFLMGSPRDHNVVLMSGDTNDGLAVGPVIIPVHCRARRLAFLHACNIPKNKERLHFWSKATSMPPVGKYRINYADGSSCEIPLRYRWNIMDWNSKMGAFKAQIAYAGKTKAGFRIQLLMTEWNNPSPEKVIKNITVSTAANQEMSLALFAVSVQSNEGNKK